MTEQRRSLSPLQIDSILASLGRAQLGLVTVHGAAAAGVDRRALARRRSSGALIPVFAEVMRLSTVAITAEQRVLAASLAVPGSTVTATSAAVAHRMPVLTALGDDQPIVATDRRGSARTAGVRVVRSSWPLPTQPWFTTRVATPSATLVQLPRFVGEGVVERCLDHCLAHRLVSVQSVRNILDRIPARAMPGRSLLLELLGDRSTGIGHRSGLEQTVAPWLDEAGLGGWRRNYRVIVCGEQHVEVDFGWPRQRVALEVSPFFTHGSRAQQERDAERRRLLVAAGWRVIEATDPDLDDQHAFGVVITSLTRLLTDESTGSGAVGPAQRDSLHPTNRAAG